MVARDTSDEEDQTVDPADPTHPQYLNGYQAGLDLARSRAAAQPPPAATTSGIANLPRFYGPPRPVLGTQFTPLTTTPLTVTPTSVNPTGDEERGLPRRRRRSDRPFVAPITGMPAGPPPGNYGRVT